MNLEAFNAGCNIIGIRKNNIRYGMCCAWAQMVDYDKLTMLLGSQSVTGKVLEKGDIVGISALSKGQDDAAIRMGDGHSNETDKWQNIPNEEKDTAILVKGARSKMVCRIREIIRLKGIEADAFLYLDVLSFEQEPKKEFLGAYEVLDK
ncbi:MAG TPA: flavin reductase [Bacillota bacterium]|nr:flavin reductase [Bacillota bacterium]HPF42981.1 flavin reductase [Bacillota bacterium]HPJ85838.1 flavin reductase [Bacillota bacterium]HPQ62149.1 flavin reductase [Bacillota bacterium]